MGLGYLGFRVQSCRDTLGPKPLCGFLATRVHDVLRGFRLIVVASESRLQHRDLRFVNAGQKDWSLLPVLGGKVCSEGEFYDLNHAG